MKFLRDLQIKYKLLLILLLPMGGVLYLSFNTLEGKYFFIQEMDKSQQLSLLFNKISTVVTALQNEREASVLFLEQDEDRKKFNLENDKTQTDKVLALYSECIQELEKNLVFPQVLESSLKDVSKELSTLNSLRSTIAQRSLHRDEASILFNRINQKLIAFLFEMVKLLDNKETYFSIRAQVIFLEFIELASLEKSALDDLFTQKYFEPGDFAKFVELVALQNSHFERALDYLGPLQRVNIRERLQDKAVEETERLRAIAYKSADGVLAEEVQPEHWREVQGKKIDSLRQITEELAATYVKQIASTEKSAINHLTVFTISTSLSIVVMVFLVYFVLMSILNPLKKALEISKSIAKGNLNNSIGDTNADEMGQLLLSLDQMQIILKQRSLEEKRITEEALRINQALDAVTTSVFITDNHYKIIYANQSAFRLFKEKESKIRKYLPYFDASKLLGSSIDDFHKDPGQQHRILNGVKTLHRTTIKVGELTMDLIITPVVTATGERAGWVSEWNDRTGEVAIEQEVNAVMHAASQGNFQQRITLEDKVGFFRNFSENLNKTLDFNQQMIEELRRVFAAVVRGDLTQTITKDYAGALEQLKSDVNMTVAKLTSVMNGIKHTADAASQGDFNQRIDLSDKEGFFRMLSETINQTVDFNQQIIEELNRVFAAVSRGDLTQTIIKNYAGSLNQLKNNVNATVARLTSVMNAIKHATDAASQGDFSQRIDLSDKEGFFCMLSDTINQTLDFNQQMIDELKRVFAAVSRGDLTQTIVKNYAGSLEQLKNDVNATVARLTSVMNAIKHATDAASQGDFSQRIDLSDKEGFFNMLSETINQTLDFNQQMIDELKRVFAAVLRGDLSQTITKNYAGSLEQLKNNVNATVGRLTNVMNAIKHATDAASQGDFSRRIDLSDKEGFFRMLSETINQTLDFNQQIIEELMHVFAAVARGDLSQTITKNYAGSLERLKNDVNTMIMTLTSVMNGIKQTADAASQGDFSQRIDLSNKQGFFRVLSEVLNQILDYNQQIIEELMEVFAAVAQGDLTHLITRDYAGSLEQLKNDVNMTVTKLTTVMSAIKQSAESVSIAAAQISKGNLSLSQRTEQQAAALQETASSMEEMTSTVQQNADNARQATQLAASARDRAQQGGNVVGSAISAMAEINNSSKQVADIINVINDIAFQTNLLALNAAVEAARAGEQGRGFAVVATEVRNLAQRSGAAAKEIKKLIQDSVSKVEEGTRLVNQSGDTLQEIVTAVKKVSDIILEIAAASQEQSSGIHQVNKAVGQMEEMTQQNAALVQQSAAASTSMSQQAENLKEHVGFFKTAEGEVKSIRKTATPATRPLQTTRHIDSTFDADWKDF